MANRIINPDSIPYLEKFFDNHKLFYVTDFPWQIFNAESKNAFSTINNTSTNLKESIWNPDENKRLRYKWMCDEYGFFNVIRNERSSFLRILEYALNKDNPSTLRQRRYLTQQLVEFNGVTNNPIHFSVKPNVDNAILDLDDYKSCRDFELICHPGGTRAGAHTFLRSNAKKLFLYINKKYFLKMEFKYSGGVEEIKHWDELVNYFEPNFDSDIDLIYDFTSNEDDIDNNPNIDTYKNKMKYHRQTECNVLKLFELKCKSVNPVKLEDIIGSHHIQHKRKQRFLKTETFQSDALVDSYNISKILTNSVLNVYCNNPKAGELWKFLCRNRNNLLDRKFKNRYDAHVSIDLHSISDYMRNHRPQFQDEIDSNLYDKILGFFRVTEGIMLENNLIDEYRFDFDDKYIEIENDFSKIVKRNNYKGYAIWIDKDVSAIMDREVYEFLYIVRNDIAITKTKNDKVAIINCEHEDWKGNRLNTKSVWIIEDDFACKEVEGNSVERYEKTYKDDRQDGLRTGWYENGKKEEEGTYKDGKKDGKWTGWYENGQKKDKGTWKNGIKSGDNIQYYSNGQKYKKRTFVIFPVNEGLLDGLMTMWYENGQIMRELYYKKNQWNGRETCWYKNGQKRYEGHHIKNKKEGEWLEWNKDGSIKSKTFYKKGEIDTHGVDKKWNKLLK